MLHDFMGLGRDLGADHCDDFNHVEYASKLRHQAQLPDTQGTSTFGDTQQLVLHHPEGRDITTIDLLPAFEIMDLQFGVRREDQPDITVDEDAQVDLELRLGVNHPEDLSGTDESRAEPVPQVHELPVQLRRAAPVLPAGETNLGVAYRDGNNTWHAHVYDPSAQLGKFCVNLGGYATSDEAKRARDKGIIKLLRGRPTRRPYKLNFPESEYAEYMQEHSDWSPRDFIWKLKSQSVTFANGSSCLKGVRVYARSSVPNYYQVTIGFTDSNGKHYQHISGGFATEEEAGRAYDKALVALKGDDVVTNFRPSSYSAAEIQETRQGLAQKFPNYFAASAAM